MSEPPQSESSNSGDQQILYQARNISIDQAVFNSVGRDQVNQNYYGVNPLWSAIEDVRASHYSEPQAERGGCLPGTCEAIIQEIHKWRTSKSPYMPVCWLSGTQGAGKSTIAITIAEECEQDGLVASFFFSRSDPRRDNPDSLILSIVHGLVIAKPSLKPLIDQRIAADPRILKASMEVQYRELVLNHLSLPSADTSPGLVIIDGLDECGNAAVQQRIVSTIVSTYQQYSTLPLLFLICSRPEPWIQQEFNRYPGLVKHIQLDGALSSIISYLLREFQNIRQDPSYSVPATWPSTKDIALLASRANGQFTFAITAMRFIKSKGTLPTDQLKLILHHTTNSLPSHPSTSPSSNNLEKLYNMILTVNSHLKVPLIPILAAILIFPQSSTSHLPILSSPQFIELVLELNSGTVIRTLLPFCPVLNIGGQNNNIHVYHESFTNFLFDPASSGEFFIDQAKWKDILACQWTRALIQQYINQPLHLGGRDPASPKLTEMLLCNWAEFCLENISEKVMLEMDKFYRLILTVCAESLGYDTLLHILAGVIFFPPELRRLSLIQLLLGLEGQDWSSKLLVFRRLFWKVPNLKNDQKIDLKDCFSIFESFLLDKTRSKDFFLDEAYQSHFFAKKSLQIRQTDAGLKHNDLCHYWSRIVTNVSNPDKELLSELGRLDLHDLWAQIFNPKWDPKTVKVLPASWQLLRDFQNIATWLKSQANDTISPQLFEVDKMDLVIQLENLNGGKVSELNNVAIAIITILFVSRNQDRYSSMTFVLRCLYSWNIDNLTNNQRSNLMNVLASVKFWRLGWLAPSSDSECIATPIPDASDMFHLNIQAGHMHILKTFVAKLQATNFYLPNGETSLLDPPFLFTECVPQLEVLSLCQTTIKLFAQVKRKISCSWKLSESSRDKLISWFESSPAEYRHISQDVKDDILFLAKPRKIDELFTNFTNSKYMLPMLLLALGQS